MPPHPLWQSKLELRIDWSEMDLFGHVNNVAYLKYVQAARVHFWERMGLGSFQPGGIGPTLASVGCQFKAPLHYPGRVTILSRCSFMKTSSFGLEHHLLNEFGALCAEAQDVVVLFDYGKQEKVALSDELRGILTELKLNDQ